MFFLLNSNNNLKNENKFLNILTNAVSKEDIKKVFDKYTWVPAKNILYFIKYSTGKNGNIVGVIFGVDLKTNKVIKSIPDKIAKATGYIKKIKDNKEGNVYYIYDKVPNPETDVIINHKKYKIIRVK